MNENDMFDQLKTAYASIDRIGADGADKLLRILDRAPDAVLLRLLVNKVKFCWMPARRRLVERGYDLSYLAW